ncbi:hypothetical protein COV82_02510 [Candidatus Peregrinibacteria bacterium CG11_big_fil_rev_8_21_14_0_20_46_8]|nr:MAG: hypothetical protein COV82_02510 [Candidatus Peregrinibacteria bacterium CG11_big_fil_rev_8_21_14_0_20_46_8]
MDQYVKKILKDLIDLNAPISKLNHLLYENREKLVDIEDQVLFTRSQLVHIIDQTISGKISKEDLSTWAETLEAQDGIAYEEQYMQKIADILFLLSTPEINGELTNQKLEEYKSRLYE